MKGEKRKRLQSNVRQASKCEYNVEFFFFSDVFSQDRQIKEMNVNDHDEKTNNKNKNNKREKKQK